MQSKLKQFTEHVTHGHYNNNNNNNHFFTLVSNFFPCYVGLFFLFQIPVEISIRLLSAFMQNLLF